MHLGKGFNHGLVMKLVSRNSTALIQIELYLPINSFVSVSTSKLKLMHACFKVYHHIKYLLALLCANHLCISIECYATDTLKKRHKIMKGRTDEKAREKFPKTFLIKGIMWNRYSLILICTNSWSLFFLKDPICDCNAMNGTRLTSWSHTEKIILLTAKYISFLWNTVASIFSATKVENQLLDNIKP